MKKRGFIKNVLVLLLSQGFIKILGVIYKLYLTNNKGYGDMGNALFIAAFQVYAFFLTICSIGVPNAISCLVSEKFAKGKTYDAYRILKVSLTIFGFLGFLSSSLLFLLANIIANRYLQMPETELVIRILAPSIFMISITSILKGYFNGKQKISITANSLFIEQLYRTALTVGLVKVLSDITRNNTIILVYAVAFASTIGEAISLLYIYLKFIKSKKEIWTDIITSKDLKKEKIINVIKNILKISFPIALCALISMGNKTIDALTIVRILKKNIGEEEAVRLYGILSGKIESLIMFPVSFNIAITTTLIPTVSELRAKGEFDKNKKLLKLVMLTGILIGIPFFIITFTFPEEILTVLFPNASDGCIILKYSSIIIIIAILTQTINSYLQGMNKMLIQIISVGIGCVIKFLLNVILIGKEEVGIYGAVISNVVSYLTIFIILVSYIIKKEKINFPLDKFFIKPIIISVILHIGLEKIYRIIIVRNSIIKLGVTIIIEGILYLILIFLFKMISMKNIKIAKR